MKPLRLHATSRAADKLIGQQDSLTNNGEEPEDSLTNCYGGEDLQWLSISSHQGWSSIINCLYLLGKVKEPCGTSDPEDIVGAVFASQC